MQSTASEHLTYFSEFLFNQPIMYCKENKQIFEKSSKSPAKTRVF